MKLLHTLLLALACASGACAQWHKDPYASYREAVGRHRGDSAAVSAVAASWLAHARRDGDWKEACGAYRALLFSRPVSYRTAYSDSLLDAALRSGDGTLIGRAHLTAGIVRYDRKEHQEALESYLKADAYLSRTSDPDASHKLRYAIAQTKYCLGFHEEAIALLRECETYYASRNDRAYLNTLHSLGRCHAQSGRIEEARRLNRLGLSESRIRGNDAMVSYFEHSEGVNSCLLGDYGAGAALLERVLPEIEARGDFANAAVARFYLGKAAWMRGERGMALSLFEEVHRAFEERSYTRHDVRESYELAFTYHTEAGDAPAAVRQLLRLREADEFLMRNYKHLSRSLAKEYDGRRLVASKQGEVDSLQTRSLLLAALCCGVAAYGWNRHRVLARSRKKFEELLLPAEEQASRVAREPEDVSDLRHELVATALPLLARFEKAQQYRDPEVNVAYLAKLLHTNSKYASRLVAHHTGSMPTDYISGLRVDYVVERLKTDRFFRRFSHDAMAKEAGFGSTTNFNRAFKKRHGMSAYFFAREISKEEGEDF